MSFLCHTNLGVTYFFGNCRMNYVNEFIGFVEDFIRMKLMKVISIDLLIWLLVYLNTNYGGQLQNNFFLIKNYET